MNHSVDATAPAVNASSESGLLDAGIMLGGFAPAIGLVSLTYEVGPPYPDVLWFLDRVGGVFVFGMSMGFLGVLATHMELQRRTERSWMGECLGALTAGLLLLTA